MLRAEAVFQMPCAKAQRIKPATRSSVFWGVAPWRKRIFYKVALRAKNEKRTAENKLPCAKAQKK